jgi:hypothetical protein
VLFAGVFACAALAAFFVVFVIEKTPCRNAATSVAEGGTGRSGGPSVPINFGAGGGGKSSPAPRRSRAPQAVGVVFEAIPRLPRKG